MNNKHLADFQARDDFRRAYRRSFWRRLKSWMTGEKTDLLPYDEVKAHLPFQSQRYIGQQTVPIDKIVGSVGRYRDFDRVFLPTQTQTEGRWVSISKARYEDVELPPVDLYKIGDVYFVKDGNHRVSVARGRGQSYIEGIVTEIEVPIPITPETEIDDLIRQKHYASFLQETNLHKLRPEADLQLSSPLAYERLLAHISAHRWYMGEQNHKEIPYADAVGSWYDNVYEPLWELIAIHQLPKAFPEHTPADLYLWVSEYKWVLREAYTGEDQIGETTKLLAELYIEQPVAAILSKLRRATWLDKQILEQERQRFLTYTRFDELRPDADIRVGSPGAYDALLGHISAHRWYMGEKRQQNVPYEEAVADWYDNAYMPMVEMIREQGVLDDFRKRTEADLYLWLVEHRESWENGGEIPVLEEE
ncbi:MAG TPA: hypothetical protein VLL52_04765 [Anaerolineae bacterium]|nr:hypothetical protein [Anaerolineae bacterium]